MDPDINVNSSLFWGENYVILPTGKHLSNYKSMRNVFLTNSSWIWQWRVSARSMQWSSFVLFFLKQSHRRKRVIQAYALEFHLVKKKKSSPNNASPSLFNWAGHTHREGTVPVQCDRSPGFFCLTVYSKLICTDAAFIFKEKCFSWLSVLKNP